MVSRLEACDMQVKEYENWAADLLAYAHQIETDKRPGYTFTSNDVHKNFKSIAERIGITPFQVWLVYFLKHVDAITTALSRRDAPAAEPLQGRFADAVNYLKLGWTLYVEDCKTDDDGAIITPRS